MADTSQLPVLDLSWAADPDKKFDVGFLYITNHGVQQNTTKGLTDLLPALFALPNEEKAALSKLNSPHFLGYSGFAEETTLGKQDLREQFDFATELPVVYRESGSIRQALDEESNGSRDGRDFTKLYWRLRGGNQWPLESSLPGFREAFTQYHDAVQALSYSFVHLVEEAFSIPGNEGDLDVGAHKDSSGWLTFLYQVGSEPGLEVLSASGDWIAATPIPGSFVVNFGNAFEAATEGAVKATIHRVIAPGPESNVRYSIPFFQGLPLDMTVSEVREYVPENVRRLRKDSGQVNDGVSTFLDPRWDSLGESQSRKWIRSHRDVALKWYGQEVLDYYAN